jgi:hypothetical protein
MWQQVRMAAVAMALVSGTTGIAYAQITQDPGRLTPGNLRSQQLGPSVDLPSGNTGSGEGSSRSENTNTNRTTPGYGANPSNMGAGGGAGLGGSSSGLSRGIRPGR